MRKHIVAAACLVAMGASAQGQVRHFTADDLPKIVRVTDPQVSPDGKTIAFVVGGEP